MKPAQLRDQSVEELRQKEAALRRELFNLRFQQATGEIENPKRINTVRKDIARILTIVSQKTKAQKGGGGK